MMMIATTTTMMMMMMLVMMMTSIICGKGEEGKVHNSSNSSFSSIQSSWQQKGFFPKKITSFLSAHKCMIIYLGGPGHSLCGTGQNKLPFHLLENLELLHELQGCSQF